MPSRFSLPIIITRSESVLFITTPPLITRVVIVCYRFRAELIHKLMEQRRLNTAITTHIREVCGFILVIYRRQHIKAASYLCVYGQQTRNEGGILMIFNPSVLSSSESGGGRVTGFRRLMGSNSLESIATVLRDGIQLVFPSQTSGSTKPYLSWYKALRSSTP